ncbi:MAG: NAD(P)/FAD-dependent oxidoreductase [Candidatus Thorarchaeota archaeon]
MYDVAIIGAGPSGSTTARYLAKLGYDVCLIDKSRFPRDKPCGGGFSPRLVDEFPHLKRRQGDFLKGVCQVGVLHSSNRKTVLRGRADMAVALRKDFDNILLESALEYGVEPKLGNRAKSVQIDAESAKVELAHGNAVVAHAIVGADGATSMVARTTGLNVRWPSDSITACRVVEMPTKTEDIIDRYSEELEYHFFANLGGLPGYGWIFPKLDTINVGLGIVGKYAKGLPRYFESFIKMLRRDGYIRKSVDLSASKGALLPTGGTIAKSYSQRCLLIGDSAGMVNPITGGGIAHAMVAGKIAAAVLARNLENDALEDSDLSRYQTLWMTEFGKEIKSQLIVQKVFTGVFADTLFEIGARDSVLQNTVSAIMSEASGDRSDAYRLFGRFLYVCLREAFTP